MPKTKIQNMTEVKRWFDEGRTYKWMTEQYLEKYHIETTPAYWSTVRRRQGWERRTHRDKDLIPWRVATEHSQQYPIIMLRAEARTRAGRPVSDDLRVRLEAWRESLEEKNAVVLYDRELGFFYVPRKDSDDDIIRRPEQVKIITPQKNLTRY